MMMTSLPCYALVLALAAVACAQDGQGHGTWLYDVTTQDGDEIVEPGESATVDLYIDLHPSVHEVLPDGYFVLGFGEGYMDVVGGQNAGQGEILGWQENIWLLQVIGPTGTTDGVNIFDISLAQLATDDTFDPSDPIHLISFEWQPVEYSEYSVEYIPLIEYQNGIPGFSTYKWKGPNDIKFEIWSIDAMPIEIKVVPTPTILFLSSLCSLAILNHRRGNLS